MKKKKQVDWLGRCQSFLSGGVKENSDEKFSFGLLLQCEKSKGMLSCADLLYPVLSRHISSLWKVPSTVRFRDSHPKKNLVICLLARTWVTWRRTDRRFIACSVASRMHRIKETQNRRCTMKTRIRDQKQKILAELIGDPIIKYNNYQVDRNKSNCFLKLGIVLERVLEKFIKLRASISKCTFRLFGQVF